MRRGLLIGAGFAVLFAIGTVAYFKTRDLASPESILARLPADNAAVLSIDFQALRQAGIFEMLSGPVVEEEPEYKTFAQKIAFDYRRDLDHAFVAFHPGAVYFLVRGRFDWKRLEAYAREQGGGCSSGVCRMPGSQPSRKISFFALKSDLMAMAVSADESAATRLSEPARSARPMGAPKQPLWLSLPSSTLKNSAAFPTGTQLFAKAMEDAESAVLSIGPRGKALEAQLEVVCKDAREASVVTAQFQRMTDVLRQIIEKEKQKPNPADLSGVLTAGVFQQENARVLGRWPIERVFLDNLSKP